MYDSAPSEQGDLPLRWSRVEASWRRKRQKRLDLLQDLARRCDPEMASPGQAKQSSFSQPTNQPASQPTNQPASQPTNQLTNQLTNTLGSCCSQLGAPEA